MGARPGPRSQLGGGQPRGVLGGVRRAHRRHSAAARPRRRADAAARLRDPEGDLRGGLRARPTAPAGCPCRSASCSRRRRDRDAGHRRPPLDLAEEARKLADGVHRDPHQVLGAHPRGDVTVVRAFHPDALEVSIAHPGGVVRMKRVDGRGLFEGEVPVAHLPGYRLRYPHRRRRVGGGRPLPLPADARRARPAPHRRGDALPPVGAARRTRHRPPGRARHRVRGVGAAGARRVAGQRHQRLGRRAPCRCARSAPAACGRSSSPTSARACATSSASSAPTDAPCSRPTRWRAPPSRRRRRRAWSPSSTHTLDRRRVDRAPRGRRPHRCARCRSTRCTSARGGAAPTTPLLSYRELAAAARRPLRAHGLHPRRAAAPRRASLRRLLGLPGEQLLRADVALRVAGRPALVRRPPPRSAASG